MASEGEDRSLYKEAFRQQMEAIKGELHSKSTEVESLKARNKELEDVQMRQEDTINALKRQNKKVCVSFSFLCFFKFRYGDYMHNHKYVKLHLHVLLSFFYRKNTKNN